MLSLDALIFSRCNQFSRLEVESQEPAYVGFVIIDKDGTLNVEYRVRADGTRVRSYFQVKPGDSHYQWFLDEVEGEMLPGHRYGIKRHPQ